MPNKTSKQRANSGTAQTCSEVAHRMTDYLGNDAELEMRPATAPRLTLRQLYPCPCDYPNEMHWPCEHEAEAAAHARDITGMSHPEAFAAFAQAYVARYIQLVDEARIDSYL